MAISDRIPLFKVRMADDAGKRVQEVLQCGYIGQGPVVDRFEYALKTQLGLSSLPITTSSGTAALDLAFHLIGINGDGYVISTPMTCLATNCHLKHRGTRIIWSNVHATSGLIDCQHVKKIIHKHGRPQAIISVDWAGCQPDYHNLIEIAEGVPIVQDAAHSIGAPLYGDYVTYSFQAIKHLTTCDGGALITPRSLEERARLLRWYGFDRTKADSMRCEQDIEEVGFKYHMNDIAAAVGLANLHGFEECLDLHSQNAAIILGELGNDFDPYSSYWFVPITVEKRDRFIKSMGEHGIYCSPVHRRNDRYKAFGGGAELPGVEEFDNCHVGLPCGWWMTKEEAEYVGRTARELLA